MRAKFWLRLRNSRLLRALYTIPILAGPMRTLSYRLLPSSGQRVLSVLSGPGKGLKFELNPRWETPLWEGRYETELEYNFLEKLGPHSVFYDVGASIGFYSLLAARVGARVFAFEPDNRNADSFEHNAELNALGAKMELYRIAVTSWTGTGHLLPAGQDRGHGNAHLVREDGKKQGSLGISCTTLDYFSEARPYPDIIKIDVEGSESDVFRGAESLFTRCRPKVICEIHDADNSAFVVNWLVQKRYNVRWLEGPENFPKHLIAIPE
jgi:FkbM family methyltransferase